MTASIYYFMKNILFIIAIINGFVSFGQNNKSVYIFDSISKKPVSFSTIHIYEDNNLKNGYYADENGLAFVNCNIKYEIIITHIGYENFEANCLNLQDTIFLNQKTIYIDEVIITNTKSNLIELGDYKLKKDRSLNAFKGFEITKYFKNESNDEKRIYSVILNLFKRNKKTVILKINLYSVNADNTPGNLINDEEIIYYLKNKVDGKVEINVNNKNIILPKNGVFLSVECLGFIDDNGKFIFDNEMWHDFRFFLTDSTENNNYSRNKLKTSKWYKDLLISLKQTDKLNYKYYPSAAFGLKVYIE